jgi:large repetitive protein
VASGVIVGEDQFTVQPNSAANPFNVLANDSSVRGGSLWFRALTQPANGRVELLGRDVMYTPRANFTGADSFTYTVVNDFGDVATAAVNVMVEPPKSPSAGANRAPIAQADSLQLRRNAAETAVNVLANDSDPDGDALRVTAFRCNVGTGMLVTGVASYRVRSGWTGTDACTYTVSDARGATATSTVSVVVTR